MKTALFIFVIFSGISSSLQAQGIEGRYWINNQRSQPVVVEHYQGQEFYVLKPQKFEGFLRINTDQKVAKGLWALLEPQKKRAITGEFSAVRQTDGSLTVTMVQGNTTWTEQWMPAPAPSR
jgi:hypothetical protein